MTKHKRKLRKSIIMYILFIAFIVYELNYAYLCHTNKDIEAARVNTILDELGY